MGFTIQSIGEISVSLKVLRIVPVGSEIFRLSNLNDVDGLKFLFSRGLASPLDVNTENQPAIWVRFYFLAVSNIPDQVLVQRIL